MLDVLMYLFEHYMDESAMIAADQDQDALKTHLSEAGFDREEIRQALGWLDGLARHPAPQQMQNQTNNAIRIYNQHERQRLDTECRGYLHFLEDSGILNPSSRELVIDRALALGNNDFDLDQLKWVILMVLFKQAPQGNPNGWLEDLIFSEPATSIH